MDPLHIFSRFFENQQFLEKKIRFKKFSMLFLISEMIGFLYYYIIVYRYVGKNL